MVVDVTSLNEEVKEEKVVKAREEKVVQAVEMPQVANNTVWWVVSFLSVLLI